MKRLLEICCADTESVMAAINGGADRIELCSALSEGGVTPSAAFIEYAVKASTIPVNVLIRPRGGDFVYTSDEIDMMVSDINFAGRSGASGVVIGALLPNGDIDVEACQKMADTARSHNLSITFHRAFDLCSDPLTVLNKVINLGANRLLTSGQAPSAIKGAHLLSTLIQQADNRIIVMPGAGINATNVLDLIEKTGAKEVHASASETIGSMMTYRNPKVSMGNPEIDEYSRKTTSIKKVKEIANIVHNIQ